MTKAPNVRDKILRTHATAPGTFMCCPRLYRDPQQVQECFAASVKETDGDKAF